VAGALRLHQELLLDRVRILGPDHSDTLATQNTIAYFAYDGGVAAES
jgi:hypothetical protein